MPLHKVSQWELAEALDVVFFSFPKWSLDLQAMSILCSELSLVSDFRRDLLTGAFS